MQPKEDDIIKQRRWGDGHSVGERRVCAWGSGG